MTPNRGDRLAAWWRTFAVQGSWNYRTLVGGGIAYGMLPLLRRIHAGDPVRLRESLERHLASFNGHPYLCAMAVSALARVEHDGEEPEKIVRFRAALRGPLGTLGDRAVWAEWRPFSLLVALVLFGAGAGPLTSAAVFLVLYNAGHVYLRAWAFRRGWEAGLAVGQVLRESWVERVTGRLWPANMLLLGAAVVLVGRRFISEMGAPPAPLWPLLAAGAVLASCTFRWPRVGGRIAVGLLLSIPIAWMLLGTGR